MGLSTPAIKARRDKPSMETMPMYFTKSPQMHGSFHWYFGMASGSSPKLGKPHLTAGKDSRISFSGRNTPSILSTSQDGEELDGVRHREQFLRLRTISFGSGFFAWEWEQNSIREFSLIKILKHWISFSGRLPPIQALLTLMQIRPLFLPFSIESGMESWLPIPIVVARGGLPL